MFQNLFNESNQSINLIIAVDNITIDYNSTGQLEVKDSGISTNKLANNAVTTPKIADEAVTNDKISDMDASKLTGTVTVPIDTTNIQTDNILVGDGTAGLPSVAFKLDPTSGIYRSNIGELCMSSGGTQVLVAVPSGFRSTGFIDAQSDLTCGGDISGEGSLEVAGPIWNGGGTVGNPSYTFSSDHDTGIYRPSDDNLSVATGGVQVANFNTDTTTINSDLLEATSSIYVGQALQVVDSIYTGNGSLSPPAYTFTSDQDTGMYLPSADNLGIATGSSQVANFNMTTTNINSTNLQANTIKSTDGTSSSPAYTFTSGGAGIYKNSASTLSVASNSTEVARFNSSQNQMFVPLLMGSNSISSSGNITANDLSITSGGIVKPQENMTGRLDLPSGLVVQGFNWSNTGAPFANKANIDSLFQSQSIVYSSPQTTAAVLDPGASFSLPSGINSTFFGYQIVGYLYVAATQSLSFKISFDDGGDLFIDGLYLGGVYGAGPFSSQTATVGPITLQAGYHKIVYRFYQATGGWQYQMWWNQSGSQAQIPITNLFYDTNDVIFRNSDGMSITGNKWTSSNIGINTNADSSTPLKLVLASTPGLGTKFASFGSSSGERIQFFDETLSSGVGSTMLFSNGFKSAIRSSGTLEFWPSGVAGASIGLTSTNTTIYTTSINSVLSTDGSKNLVSTQLTNGQLLIGRSSNTPIAGTLTGTANQVVVTNGSGSITLSLPQNIDTSATPTFGGGFLNGVTVVGNNSVINTGIQKLMLYGTDNSVNGPHIQTFTSADNYPLFQLLSLQHNNIILGFDVYYDGTNYRSSNATCNYQIGKSGNELRVLRASGAAQGTVPSLTIASYWDLNGNYTCNQNLAVAGNINSTGQPCLIMSASSYISVSTATDTLFNGFDTVDFAQGSIGFVSNSTATVPTAGKYMISFEMGYDSVMVGLGVINMYIVKNGSNPPRYGQQISPIPSGNVMNLSSSVIMQLAASDTIQVYVYQNSGANLHCGSLGNGIARLEISKLY